MPEPQRPGGEAALPPERPEPADVGHARQPADDRDVAVVAVAERLVRAGRGSRRRMTLAAYDPPWIAPWATPGRRLVRLPRLDRRVADHEDLGVARDGQVGLDEHPPGAIGRRRRSPAATVRANVDASDAGRPEHGPRRDRLLACRRRRRPGRRRSSMSITRVRVRTSTPSRSSWRCAETRAVRRIRRQDPVHRLDQDDPRLARAGSTGSRAGACRGRSRRARRPARRRSVRRRPARTSSTRGGGPGRPRARRPRRR